ncbi:hypothetical protein C8R43DRAFT_941019 [Mycena crocata]|nr:hypothetical protein C8R43DRAFT_941019 [Mycena crocata]
MSDVQLSLEQTKLLALNPKFVPRPKATLSASVTSSVDDFDRRLRLRVDKELDERKCKFDERKPNNLHQYLPVETGYPEFHFMASFKKPTTLGDRLNTTNQNTLRTYHTSIVAPV